MLFALLLLVQLVAANMHFYLDGNSDKCFFKQLVQDSVLGVRYKIEAERDGQFVEDSQSRLNLLFTVEETFDNNHMVANRQQGEDGRFIFTALDTGQHKLCLIPVTTGGFRLPVRSRVTIDVATGGDVLQKGTENLQLGPVLERLQSLLDEYRSFRAIESEFRDMSETVNSSTVRWIILQVLILGGVGYLEVRWMLSFFVKQKVM